MRIVTAWLVTLFSVAPVWASDKVETGPAPSWVKAAIIPEPDAKAEGSLQFLLRDQQYKLEPGRLSSYTEVAFKIQTSEGLAAGNITLPWRPDIDALTVHHVAIWRGGQRIDVLASGQSFSVLRRENNLESAMLDGVLTANIQPEGLQVGDILDFAVTLTSSDPSFGRHVEQIGAGLANVPVGRLHFSAVWPASVPVRFRQTPGLPAMKPKREGDLVKLEASVDRPEPFVPAKGAPSRFSTRGLVELSDFRDWSELAALFAPLYEKAAKLPAAGPLQDEISRIRAASADAKLRAEATLMLVESRVRYVALLMGSGNFVPADATTTWTRRFGDCKAKTALLLAILRELDIQAEPVIVNAFAGDGLDERLPMINLFNHVIVRATIGGKTYWLDGTRTGDTRLDQLKTPDFGWGLPLVRGATLVRMLPPPAEAPTISTSLRIDARSGISRPAPAHAERVLYDDEAYAMSIGIANLTADARDRWLRDYWKSRYDFIDIKSVTASYDPERREQRLVMDGEARMEWRGGTYWTIDSDIGFKADFDRDVKQDRTAPFTVGYPAFSRTTETYLLPPGIKADDAEVAQTIAGVEYKRHATTTGTTLTIETSERSVMPEFPANEAPAAQIALRALAKQHVALRIGPQFRQTKEEIAEQLAKPAKTAAEFVARGSILLDKGDLDGAFAEYDKAVVADPKDAQALAGRGLAQVWRGNYAAAAKDFDAATAIQPDNIVVQRGRGLAAQNQGQYDDAIAAFSLALAREPGDIFTLGHRAQSYRALKRDEAALRDSAMALKAAPDWIDMYLLRATIFRNMGQIGNGKAEALALVEANPNKGYAHVAAARIYHALGSATEAASEFERALAIKPEAYIYYNRSQTRQWDDVAGRLADLNAALRIDPKDVTSLSEKAALQRRSGHLSDAIATLSSALALQPRDVYLLVQRGASYELAGRRTEASKDYAAARAVQPDATALNALCWIKATLGVQLQTALAECDEAIAKRPDSSAIMDSRAFVLLKLGRIDEAIEAYDRVIAKSPYLAQSLFGRAIAWARKGDKAKAEADQTAASRADPDVANEFRDYGMTL